jgi:tellurite methyltransferase
MDSKMKWNIKHKAHLIDLEEPNHNSRLQNMLTYLHGGTALDLACGLGGNSLLLARRNYVVEAIDISEVACNYLKEHAENLNLTISPHVEDLNKLNDFHMRKSSYDLVVMAYYLNRSLFPLVKTIIKENGYFFMETYYLSEQNRHVGVSDRYKLNSQELLVQFSDWKVLFYEENEFEGRQTIFCQKPN